MFDSLISGQIKMFSNKSVELLTSMRIDAAKYYEFLFDRFGDDAYLFSSLIECFDSPKKIGNNNDFSEFCSNNGVLDSSEIFNWLFEFYNNLHRYFEGGVYNLFKTKQAEWGAPRVNIKLQDVPGDSDMTSLDDPQIIYRGLSESEHEKQDYAQSWTIDINQAKRFACEVYSDELSGIVVEAEIAKGKIIYFNPSDSEKEIIIEQGAVVNAVKIYSIP